MRQTVPWNQGSFCLWRYHFRTQQIQQLPKCVVSQSSAWQGRAFVQCVIKKDFSYFYSQHTHHIHGCPIPTPTEHEEQQPKATCNTDVQPPAEKPKHPGNAQMREATPWRAGKATAAAGRPAEPKGKMKQGEKSPKLHHKLHQLLAEHPK